MACLRLLTDLPLRPLFSFPRFIRCMADFTRLPAARPYFLAITDLLGADVEIAPGRRSSKLRAHEFALTGRGDGFRKRRGRRACARAPPRTWRRARRK